MRFDYTAAFSRNIGWVTEAEQQILRSKRIAIAGLGGAGGAHLLTLARLGIGSFHIADFDTFEIHNLNRQAGASISHLDRPKVEVMAELARDINPELELSLFAQGVTPENLRAFFSGVDLYVDGLDFFAFEAREMVFATCAEMGIPAITVAPLGMSAALLTFLPGKMTLEEFFQVAGQPESEKALRFLLGLAPAGLHFDYLVDPSRVDLANRRGPSTGMACQICAGIAGTEALKILLQRGKVYAAPYGVHFDAYSNRLKITWRPGGNRNPLQRLALAIGRKRLVKRLQAAADQQRFVPQSDMERILDLARWAPSGDNTQPWRFEVVDDATLIVHLKDREGADVYDFKAWPSRLAFGTLLETLRIAASSFGRDLRWRYRDLGKHEHQLEVSLVPTTARARDPLLPYLTTRSVNRRPYRLAPLTTHEKEVLTDSVGDEFEIRWFERFSERWAITRLNALAAHIRLSIPEAYQVHREILDWERDFSPSGVPAKAVGIDPMTLCLMRWAMQNWERVRFMNGLPGGTILPQLEMDWLPGIFCAAHFALQHRAAPNAENEAIAILRAGQAMQRFWLTAEYLGLAMQPSMAPVVFATYGRQQIAFTQNPKMLRKARYLAKQFDPLFSAPEQILLMGRIGQATRQPPSRSTRLALPDLIIRP